jgi:threonyl-tRNA synthetase
MLIRHLLNTSFRRTSINTIPRAFARRSNHVTTLNAPTIQNMSAAAHPITSTSEPAPVAEGLAPVGAGEATSANSDPKAKPQQQGKKDGKDGKAGKDKKDKKAGSSSGPLELNPPPEFFAERIKIFDEYKAKYDQFVAG